MNCVNFKFWQRCVGTLLAAASIAQVAAQEASLDMPQAFPQTVSHYDFDVLLNDKVIGEHTFVVTDFNDTLQTVAGAADYRVKFLGVEVFRYQHHHNERWERGCLSDYEARTETRGELTTIIVESSPERYLVKTNSNTQTHRRADVPCLWSYAYWRPEISNQRSLLNGQTGALKTVTISEARDLGDSRAGIHALNISLDSVDEASLVVRFDDQGRWAGLEVQVSENRLLVYRRRN